MYGKLITTLIVAFALGAAPAQAEAKSPWIKLAGTSAKLNDLDGPTRLASYVLSEDAGNSNIGYLRVGDVFVRTPYRQVPVSKSGRWAAGVPDYKRYLPAHRIVLIDRVRHKEYSVKMPVGVASAQWSPDGRTLLLTAYRMWDTSYKTIGFVTVNVTERKPRLVKAGSAWTGNDADVGANGSFFWNADGTGVMSTLKNDEGIAAYDLSGRRTRVYAGVGSLEARVTSLFSPSGRQFVSLGEGDSSYTRAILIVDAETGMVVHRLRGGFEGWYDDNHVIVMSRTTVQPPTAPTSKAPRSTFRIVSLSGKAGTILIREQLRYTRPLADYKASIEWLDFPR